MDATQVAKHIAHSPGNLTTMPLLGETLQGRALIAIPKKGRLHERCVQLLNGADIQFTRSNRLDVCVVKNLPLALVFLPAADIPRFVGEGNVALGITGEDMVAEANMSDLIDVALPLEFGKCKLQVQVQETGDVKDVKDLMGRRVVTSFDFLAKKYFDDLAKDLGVKNTTSVEFVSGSVEAAVALGVADGIVDLVESGETMRAAGLHAISTILESQAVLIRSKHANEHQEVLDRVVSRIAGVVAANKYVLCNYNIPTSNLSESLKITPGRRAPTISSLDDADWKAVSAMVLKKEIASVMDRLTEAGACDVLVLGLENCRV